MKAPGVALHGVPRGLYLGEACRLAGWGARRAVGRHPGRQAL